MNVAAYLVNIKADRFASDRWWGSVALPVRPLLHDDCGSIAAVPSLVSGTHDLCTTQIQFGVWWNHWARQWVEHKATHDGVSAL